jgi:hypothetical protein
MLSLRIVSTLSTSGFFDAFLFEHILFKQDGLFRERFDKVVQLTRQLLQQTKTVIETWGGGAFLLLLLFYYIFSPNNNIKRHGKIGLV